MLKVLLVIAHIWSDYILNVGACISYASGVFRTQKCGSVVYFCVKPRGTLFNFAFERQGLR